MSTFLIRVELHGKEASHPDYAALHDLLQKAGFSRTVAADTGAAYQLPPGEYVANLYTTGAAIRTSAKEIADQVDANNAVFVVEYTDAWWVGLKPAPSGSAD